MTNSNNNADGNSSPNTGDNLPARQKGIMERLTSIRGNKQRILDTLREMKEKLGDNGEPDRELMAKMIASYDLLSAQEEDYMKIMQQIVSIRENAAEDVQHEVEEVKENKSETKKVAEGEENAVPNAESTEANKEHTDENEAEWKEVEEELAKLGSVAGEAVAASIMNEKLIEKLQLHRNKKAALEQLREKETESQRGAANEALQQVELARLKVAAEQEQIERKRRTLERLRREAVRRGIKLGPGPASEPDIVVEAPPEPKSVTEAKLRAKLNAKKKQNEEEEVEDSSPPVPENLAPPERIPPIADNEELVNEGTRPEEQSETQPGGGAPASAKKKKKGKRAREQAKERRDAINASIREKLAAIEARKQRMREIQAQLLRPVITPSEMDDTFQKAQQKLKSLTAMREHLEELRESGEALPEEAAAMLERQLEEEESEAFKDDANVAEQRTAQETLGPALDHIEQVVQSVRSEFEKAMVGGADDLAPGYRISTGDSRRLTAIEELIKEQRQLLLSLNAHFRQPITKADRSSCVLALREFLLSAQPQILREFADVILKLANGEVISGLDGVLQTFLNSADNNLPASNTSTEKEEWRGEGEAEQEPEGNSGKSTSPEMTQSVTLTLRKPTTNSDAESGREQTLQDQRIEQAKRRLSTSKAKLQKQRTLERVRCFTGDESGEEKNEEELRGLERDICRIIEGVLPWIKEHSEVIADETGMHELRDVLLQRSSAICFPDGAASDLFEKQLSTIVDDTLSQYYGEKVGADREQLIFDISEVLYNELAFFQLMHNIDNMVDTKQETFEVGSAE